MYTVHDECKFIQSVQKVYWYYMYAICTSYPSIPVSQYTSMPVSQYPSMSVSQYASVPVYQYASVPVYQYASIPVYQYASVPVYQCPSIPVCQCPSTLYSYYKSTDTKIIRKCSDEKYLNFKCIKYGSSNVVEVVQYNHNNPNHNDKCRW